MFLKYAVPERPVLLLVDGHKSHETIELVDLARSNNVILVCLPPHTTHALQPLDVSVFKSLKAHFSRSLRAWCFTKKNFVVTKRDFARVVKEPFELSFSMSNIKSGFNRCGVFPLNRDAIQSSKMLPSEIYSENGKADKATSEISTISSSAHVGITSIPDSSQGSTSELPPNDEMPSSSVSPRSSGGATPSLFSTPNSANSSITSPITSSANSSITSPITNPLVAAGLVPSNLADILSTSNTDEVQNRPKRRVFKARVLTEQEFYDTLVQKEQKEKEIEQLKEQRRIERERKKEEKEQQKKAREEEKEKKKQERERKKEEAKKMQAEKRKRKRKKTPTPPTSGSEEESVALAAPSNSRRGVRLPSRFRVDSESSDGGESDTICEYCQKREPEGNHFLD